MSDDKKIQKSTKLSLKTLTSENALAVRWLKDLQLLNTPRLKYLAGLYDECIDLCVEMEDGIKAPEPENTKEKKNYRKYGPTLYLKEPVELKREDYWYYSLSLQKVDRFFPTDIREERKVGSGKKWAYNILFHKVSIQECIKLFETRSKENLVCNADYFWYWACLEKLWNDKQAILYFKKSVEERVEVKIFKDLWSKELWRLYYKLGDYNSSKDFYLEYLSKIIFFRKEGIFLFGHVVDVINLSSCFYFLWDPEKALYFIDFIKSPNNKKANFFESKWYLNEALKEYQLLFDKDHKNSEIKEKISSLSQRINNMRKI